MRFRLGCAIWAYREWVGELFPSGSRSADFLRLYSRRLTTVEGNTTFYSIPDRSTLDRWVTETPPHFQFCLKFPRDITHSGLLTPTLPAAIAFVEQMQSLGQRLGPFFIQLPPSYGPAQQSDLMGFLQGLVRAVSPDLSIALEVRHADWFQLSHGQDLDDRLHDLGLGRVLLDTRPIYDCPDDPQLYSERRKPCVPLHLTAPSNFILIRYISHPQLDLNQRFLDEWMIPIQQWLQQGKQVYFFVHCPVEVHSPRNARHFQHLLEQQGVQVPALPWDAIAPDLPPTQLSLF